VLAPPPQWRLAAVALAMASVGLAAHAQSSDPQAPRGSFFTPTLSLGQTYVRGTGAVDGGGKGEFITRVSPGLTWISRAGRVQGSANYALDTSLYSRRKGDQGLANNLNGSLRVEAIENRAYVDAQANISQRSISPFGQQSGSDTFQANANRTEVINVAVSPYVRGSLAGVADYQLRLSGSATDSRSGSANNSYNGSASVSLRSSASQSRFGWGASASEQRVVFRQGRTTSNSRINGELNFRPDVDWLLFVNGGAEQTDVLQSGGASYGNWGGGVRWTPSPRTSATLQADRRYFGDSHRLVLEHRMSRSVFRFSDFRDATSGSDPFSVSRSITAFEDLFAQNDAAGVKDPALNALLVAQQLAVRGLNANDVVGFGSFLTTSVSLQRRQELSFSWSGTRTSFSLQAFATELSLLTAAAVGNSALSAGVKQSGQTASASYRLTPTAAVNAFVSRQVTPGSGSQLGNSLRTASLGYSEQLSRTLSLTLNARYSLFEGPISPYREAQASAGLLFRF